MVLRNKTLRNKTSAPSALHGNMTPPTFRQLSLDSVASSAGDKQGTHRQRAGGVQKKIANSRQSLYRAWMPLALYQPSSKDVASSAESQQRTKLRSEERVLEGDMTPWLILVLVLMAIPICALVIILGLDVEEDDEQETRSRPPSRRMSFQKSAPNSRKESMRHPQPGRGGEALLSSNAGLSFHSLTPDATMASLGSNDLLGKSMADTSFPTRTETLFDEMVVQDPQGILLGVPMELGHMPQQLTLEVMDISRGEDPILRAFVQESHDPGIMLETASGKPVAFVDTSFALATSPLGATGNNRHVILRRATQGGWDSAGTPFAVFFLSRQPGGNALVARAGGAPGRSRPFLSAQLDSTGKIASVFNADGMVVAVNEGVASLKRPVARVRVHQGTDAALVVCAIFAASKLA